MDEQKAKKKEMEIYKRILKWIGLTLLVILIMLALIFQAPWKMTALLLIILLACTVLPKPARKWFWLSAAGIVIALIIWVFLPEDNEGWRPYKFDEELAALEAKYAIPDSENAAMVYNQLLEHYDANVFEPNFVDPNLDSLTRKKPWLSKDHPELAQWLQQHQRTIAKLSEASKVARCAFPIPHDTFSLSDTMDYLPAMRHWAFLLIRAGNNDVAEGRIEEGLEKYLSVRKMGDHIRQQSTLLEMMLGIAAEDLALGQFKAFVVTADATEEHLSLMEKAVADIKHDWNYDWLGILEFKKLMVKNQFGEYYETDLRGRLRLSRDPKARIREWLKDVLEESLKDEYMKYKPKLWINPHYWQRKLIRAKTILYWFYLPSRPQKGADIIDELYEKYYKRAGADFDWKKEPEEISPGFKLNFTYLIEHLVVGSSAASNYRIHDLYLRHVSNQKGCQILIGLRRYKNKNGYWPEKLDEIKPLAPSECFVDPINGDSFVYKLTEANFTLYSKGKNNIDENGQRTGRKFDLKTKQFVGKEKDDQLIWPPKSRKTKEKKADAE